MPAGLLPSPSRSHDRELAQTPSTSAAMSTSELYDALPNGYTLEEYRIESMLGIGGFGVTYLAHDNNLKTKVAIKEYLPGDFATRNADHSVKPKSDRTRESFDWGLKAFVEESRTLATFRHPNIVRVMRFFEANATAYMVMEFIAGKPLKRTNLDQTGLLRIIMPLLDGLDTIHQAGYLHRDIKPPNIFIRNDGSPILIDFGSARMKATANKELTAIVSPGFSPLEQYHSQGRQGPWTDLYALAGVMYWLVTGKKPIEAAARVGTDNMPALADIGGEKYYTKHFLSAIDWALKVPETERPQSVSEWRTALADVNSVDILLDAPSPAARPVPSGATSLMQMPSGVVFDRDLLMRVQTELAPHVGPIAATMIKRAATKSSTVTDLVAMLASDIADDAARSAFIRTFGNEDSAPTSQLAPPASPSRIVSSKSRLVFSESATPASRPAWSTPSIQPSHSISSASVPSQIVTTSQLQRFDAATLQRAEAALAEHIGAVAKVLLKRAARTARNESELYLLLSDEIKDKAQRRNFVRTAIALSGKN